MIYVQPTERDLKPGTVIFMRKKSNVLSGVISWFQSLDEASTFGEQIGDPDAEPSHTALIRDAETIHESSVGGVQISSLGKYLNDSGYQIVCRRPYGLTDEAVKQAIAYGDSLVGKQPYDYSGLIGHALQIISPLDNWFPFIRKWPVPLHLFGRYCSAFNMDELKHTDLYKNEALFKIWHITRISPSLMWNLFPWEPFRLEAH